MRHRQQPAPSADPRYEPRRSRRRKERLFLVLVVTMIVGFGLVAVLIYFLSTAQILFSP